MFALVFTVNFYILYIDFFLFERLQVWPERYNKSAAPASPYTPELQPYIKHGLLATPNEGLFEAFQFIWNILNSKTTERLNISTLGAAFTNCKIPRATSSPHVKVLLFDVTFWKKESEKWNKEISMLKKLHGDGLTELNCKPESLSRDAFTVYATLPVLAFIN